MSNYNNGKFRRLAKIFKTKKIIIVPIDDSLIGGPVLGLLDMQQVITKICKSKANAILTYSGTYLSNLEIINNMPCIINLSASTMRGNVTKKEIIGSVEDALINGADAVAVHLNVSSKYENQMIKDIGFISTECRRLGMPLMIITYPRTEDQLTKRQYDYYDLKSSNKSEYIELIKHCVRIATELGADIIKTHYTGDSESFKQVISVAENIPVVISGQDYTDEHISLEKAKDAILSGAKGICFGRNVFNRENSLDFIEKLYKIIQDTNI